MSVKPRLYILIGISGAGKTTYAKQKLIPKLEKEGRNYKYLSSDDIREELYGDASCQNNPRKVFELMNTRKNIALENNLDVIFDATNIKKSDRKIALCTLADCDRIAVVFEVTERTAKMRQKKRERQVAPYVITKQFMRMELPKEDEGFIEVINGTK